MMGMVLAAGAGRRLRPFTDALPKALMPVDGNITILDIALQNFAAVGLTEARVVVGYAAAAVEQRVAELEKGHGVTLTLVHNDKAEEWNNAYSMWLGLHDVHDSVLMVNGDTVHPPSVEQALLSARGPAVLLAVDTTKVLADEEMKVQVGTDGSLTRITKQMEPASAYGEYIGVTVVEAEAIPDLRAALAATYERDPNLYYEDGYQELVRRGHLIGTTPIPSDTRWVEVDNHTDLQRAREIACLY